MSGHISLSAYEQVATSRFMWKDHQKQPGVTRKGHLHSVAAVSQVHSNTFTLFCSPEMRVAKERVGPFSLWTF